MIAIDVMPGEAGADLTLHARDTDGERATCSLWWSATPQIDGRRVGFIGRYARADAGAAQALLTAARQHLSAAGCVLAVGPVDGSTWHRYRFVTGGDARPAFAFEPENPAAYPADFEAAGFGTFARYVSAEETELDRRDTRLARAASRLQTAGITIRSFDLERFDDELVALHPVANAGFAEALLFSPIELSAFQALYRPVRAILDPRYVRIAEHAGHVVGFGFAFPDRTRGTVIAKTFARLPDRRYAGLGAVMLDGIRQTAHADGYTSIIHALMRADNASLNTSLDTATIIRTYHLFARPTA